MSGFKDLEAKIVANKYNPENIFYHSLEALNETVPTEVGTMPLVAILEHQCVTASVNNSELDLVNRYLNPNYCDTHESLARHIDYRTLNTIHAKPANTKITLALGLNDLYNNAVLQEDGSKHIVIPEDTIIGYKDTTYFGIHHAILIKLLDNDTIDISYIDNNNPLVPITNPIIESQFRLLEDGNNSMSSSLLELEITAYQFKRQTMLMPVNKTLGFNKKYAIEDQYYHARVFSRVGNTWVELDTVFSEFIYNSFSTIPTAVIKLEDNILTIEIPQIYFNRNLIGTEIKVVLYTTKGDINDNYNLSLVNDWSVVFNNNDPSLNRLTTPLNNFNSVYVYGRGKLLSGKDTPKLEDLRSEVLLGNLGDVPITDDQLSQKLSLLGYKLVHEHNYISDNLYIASKRLDNLVVDNIPVMVGAGGLDILLRDLSDKFGVFSNGENNTITPESRFKLDNGLLNILTTVEVEELTTTTIDNTLANYNSDKYLSTPFYYVLERLDYNYRVTAFELDTPQVLQRNFIGTNENNIGLISTRDYRLVKVPTGYKLYLTAITNDSFRNYNDNSFIPQLKVTDASNIAYTVIGEFDGRGEDGEFKYVFNINTNYNLSYLGTLELDNVLGIDGKYKTNLVETFNLTYNLVKELPDVNDTTYKDYTDGTKLPDKYQTITVEEFKFKFGTKLDSIYTPTKALLGSPTFKYYTEDVIAVWPEDVYETDELGYMVHRVNPDYETDDTQPPILYNKLHSAGDTIYEEDGETPVHAFKKGQLMLDDNNQPIPVDRDNHQIQTKLILVNAKYALAGDYIANIKEAILYNLEEDIQPLEATMLGLTELKYNLGTSVGKVSVNYDSETRGSIDAALSFNLSVRVDSVIYADNNMRTLISSNIRKAISEYLVGSKFASNALIANINKLIGDTVEGFTVDSINGRTDIVNFSLVNEYDIIGLKSRLVLGTDNSIKLVPDINIIYKLAK